MNKKEIIISSAVSAFLTLITATHSFAADAEPNTSNSEKCYGIAKAGLNDCSTATSSCASSSTKDGQADAFILLPKGLCERIVGGTLKAEVKK